MFALVFKTHITLFYVASIVGNALVSFLFISILSPHNEDALNTNEDVQQQFLYDIYTCRPTITKNNKIFNDQCLDMLRIYAGFFVGLGVQVHETNNNAPAGPFLTYKLGGQLPPPVLHCAPPPTKKYCPQGIVPPWIRFNLGNVNSEK